MTSAAGFGFISILAALGKGGTAIVVVAVPLAFFGIGSYIKGVARGEDRE